MRRPHKRFRFHPVRAGGAHPKKAETRPLALSDQPLRKCPRVYASCVRLLEDPSRIPAWAPAFADVVTGDTKSGWRATKSGQDFALRVVVVRDAGTVDYLREIAPGQEGGAYTRVIPRPGNGGVVIMTVPLAPDGEPAAVAATLRDELTALVSLASD
jgi:hypothetical protein